MSDEKKNEDMALKDALAALNTAVDVLSGTETLYQEDRIDLAGQVKDALLLLVGTSADYKLVTACWKDLLVENANLKKEAEQLTKRLDGWEEDARLRAQNEGFWREKAEALQEELEACHDDRGHFRELAEYWQKEAGELAEQNTHAKIKKLDLDKDCSICGASVEGKCAHLTLPKHEPEPSLIGASSEVSHFHCWRCGHVCEASECQAGLTRDYGWVSCPKCSTPSQVTLAEARSISRLYGGKLEEEERPKHEATLTFTATVCGIPIKEEYFLGMGALTNSWYPDRVIADATKCLAEQIAYEMYEAFKKSVGRQPKKSTAFYSEVLGVPYSEHMRHLEETEARQAKQEERRKSKKATFASRLGVTAAALRELGIGVATDDLTGQPTLAVVNEAAQATELDKEYSDDNG